MCGGGIQSGWRDCQAWPSWKNLKAFVAWTPEWAVHREGSGPVQPPPTRSCPDGHHRSDSARRTASGPWPAGSLLRRWNNLRLPAWRDP